MLILFTSQERPSVEARRDIVLPVELLSVLIVILGKYVLEVVLNLPKTGFVI